MVSDVVICLSVYYYYFFYERANKDGFGPRSVTDMNASQEMTEHSDFFRVKESKLKRTYLMENRDPIDSGPRGTSRVRTGISEHMIKVMQRNVPLISSRKP